jgi:hypothetical protein
MSENAIPHDPRRSDPPSEPGPAARIEGGYDECAPTAPAIGENTVVLRPGKQRWFPSGRRPAETDDPRGHRRAGPSWVTSSAITALLVCLAVLVTLAATRPARPRVEKTTVTVTCCTKPRQAKRHDRGRVRAPAVAKRRRSRHPASHRHHIPPRPPSTDTRSSAAAQPAAEPASAPAVPDQEEQTRGGPFSP